MPATQVPPSSPICRRGSRGNLGFPIPNNWSYDQFTEISNYKGQGWDLDRVASSINSQGCSFLLPATASSPDPDPESPDSDPLLKWTVTTENACVKTLSDLGTQASAYTSLIGTFILQWLRKPEYWSEGSSGTQALWHAYTPEPVTPSELALSRQACGVACDAQPVIKGTLPNRDIAHMAATSLGYLTWGVTNDPMDYGLGDLGGWALDLLQIWGSYLANTPKEDLASWLHTHLGEQDVRMGFSYSDVLADCDAWLLARSMQSNSSEGLCPPLCGTCSRKARRIELNGSISPGSREVRTIWSSHFESSLMESILEYSITYPEVKKHCSLRHMQTDSRVKRRLVYWHYPMLNLLKIRTVNQS